MDENLIENYVKVINKSDSLDRYYEISELYKKIDDYCEECFNSHDHLLIDNPLSFKDMILLKNLIYAVREKERMNLEYGA